jgi:hypothetical protein
MADETMTQSRTDCTEKVNAIIGDGLKYEDFATDPELENIDTLTVENYSDEDDGEMLPVPDVDDEGDADTHDQYVGAEVNLPIGDKMMSGKVRGRKRIADGSLIGRSNANPILDTRT